AVVGPGILLAGGGKRAARRGTEDSRQPPWRYARRRRAADRSRRRRSPAAEIRGDAPVVPVARGPEAGSALAGPPDRPGEGRRADLRRLSAIEPFMTPGRLR